MQKYVVQVYGVVIGLLALAGLFIEGSHLLGIMNVDMSVDLLRVVLAAALLYAGFVSDSPRFIQGSLAVVGVVYIGMGLLGMIDPELWGIAPTGLTGFDIGFHVITGVFALAVALMPMTRSSSSRV